MATDVVMESGQFRRVMIPLIRRLYPVFMTRHNRTLEELAISDRNLEKIWKEKERKVSWLQEGF